MVQYEACVHVLHCPIKISILLNHLCVSNFQNLSFVHAGLAACNNDMF